MVLNELASGDSLGLSRTTKNPQSLTLCGFLYFFVPGRNIIWWSWGDLNPRTVQLYQLNYKAFLFSGWILDQDWRFCCLAVVLGKVGSVVPKQHFWPLVSHLGGEPKQVAAAADVGGGKGVAGLVEVAVANA